MTVADKIIEFIIGNYKKILISILIIAIPMGYYTAIQKHVNQIDIYFEKDNPGLKFYKEFQKKYGNEEYCAIVFKQCDIFTNKNIEIIRKMSDRLQYLEGVQRVFSITEFFEAAGSGDSIRFQKIIPEKQLDMKELEKVKQKVLSNKIIIKNLISEDGKTVAILAEIIPLQEKQKKALLKKITGLSREIAGEEIELHFAGIPFVEIEMNILSQRDFWIFTPLIGFLIFIFIFFMLRNFFLTVICMVTLQITFVWSVGLYVFMGEDFNIVTSILGAILLAISIADSIHLLSQYKDDIQLGCDHIQAVKNSIKHVWLPCFFTSLTTAVGFFSFITSDIRPVKILGIFTSIGIMFAFFLTMTFLPVMLMFLKNRFDNLTILKIPKNISSMDQLYQKALFKLGGFVANNYKSIGALSIVVIFFSIMGLLKIRYETNTMNYLPDSNQCRKDLNFIEDNLGGSIPFALLIQAKSKEKDFTHPEGLKLIDHIQTNLMKEIRHFASSFSIADYFKQMNMAFNSGEEEYNRIPQNSDDILDFYELGEPEVLERIISSDFMEARLSFQAIAGTAEEAHEYFDYIITFMKKILKNDFTYQITGLSSLYLTMEENLKFSQIKSFLFAFVAIFFMMYFVCRNVPLTLITMIPNLFPIGITLGIMGWYDIPLDVSTIMIASVTIGIAVDDTIHFIVWFRRNILSGLDYKSSVIKTFKDVGKPIVITSIILFSGFFVLILGSLQPTRSFGVLTAFAMLFAVLGDLLILPALILIFKPRLSK